MPPVPPSMARQCPSIGPLQRPAPAAQNRWLAHARLGDAGLPGYRPGSTLQQTIHAHMSAPGQQDVVAVPGQVQSWQPHDDKVKELERTCCVGEDRFKVRRPAQPHAPEANRSEVQSPGQPNPPGEDKVNWFEVITRVCEERRQREAHRQRRGKSRTLVHKDRAAVPGEEQSPQPGVKAIKLELIKYVCEDTSNVQSLVGARNPKAGDADWLEVTRTVGDHHRQRELHNTRRCKPCAFVHKEGGCLNGDVCRFCHLCQPGEKRSRKREYRQRRHEGLVA
mmetsp:Transcript_129778/g.361582  ORF Transcript_129778/g.361582 Transcript_129778/m.361582 type:complete len:279 (+) Transcript_129778:42-878(+)